MGRLLFRTGLLSLTLLPGIACAQTAVLPQIRNNAGQYVPSTGSVAIDSSGAEKATQGNPLTVDTVVKTTSIDRGLLVPTAGIAVPLMPANAARRGYSVQNQSSGSCWVNAAGTATQDFHSLMVGGGSFYETPTTHVSTSAISIICSSNASAIYAREW